MRGAVVRFLCQSCVQLQRFSGLSFFIGKRSVWEHLPTPCGATGSFESASMGLRSMSWSLCRGFLDHFGAFFLRAAVAFLLASVASSLACFWLGGVAETPYFVSAARHRLFCWFFGFLSDATFLEVSGSLFRCFPETSSFIGSFGLRIFCCAPFSLRFSRFLHLCTFLLFFHILVGVQMALRFSRKNETLASSSSQKESFVQLFADLNDPPWQALWRGLFSCIACVSIVAAFFLCLSSLCSILVRSRKSLYFQGNKRFFW